jgi:hypothetical protein
VQVIVGRAQLWPRRRTVGIERLFGDDGDAAILAHLDHVEPARRALVHPVLAFERRGDALYRALDAERLAATNARERLLLLEHARRSPRIAKGKARYEADHFLGVGGFAQAALHASIFSKAQQRPVGASLAALRPSLALRAKLDRLGARLDGVRLTWRCDWLMSR